MTDREQPQAQYSTKEGFLSKTGPNNKGWRERYFVLSNGKLVYFKSEKDKDDTPLGSIDLKDVHQIAMATGKKGFSFDLTVSSGRVYNFAAKTDIERIDWMSALQSSMKTARSIHGPPSPMITSSGSVSAGGRKASISSVTGGGGGFFGRKRITSTVSKRRGSDSSIEESTLQSSISPVPQQQSAVSTSKKTDVVSSLLEVEVDALRGKITQLEDELEAAASQRKILQFKLEETKEESEDIIQQFSDEVLILKEKIQSLEDSKSKLEQVNDSLSAQVQYKDDLVGNLQQTVDELKELEEEVRQWQEEAAAAKEGLEETEQEQVRVRETLTEERQIRQKTEAQLNELSLRLEETEKERDRLKAAINIQNQKKERHIPVDELELKEEKLKLQVEIENLKISNSNEIKELEEKFSLEKESMNKQLEETKKELSQQTSESEVIKRELQDAHTKVQELTDSLKTTEERRKQLQAEKEKVVSDMIAMRKSMKEKLSSNDDTSKPKDDSSPTMTAKLAEAEGRAEMATRLLQEIQTERDSLKVQLNHRRSLSPSPSRNTLEASPDRRGLTPPPPFLIKSQPTMSISRPDVAPPKPKRPPKEILQQLIMSP